MDCENHMCEGGVKGMDGENYLCVCVCGGGERNGLGESYLC